MRPKKQGPEERKYHVLTGTWKGQHWQADGGRALPGLPGGRKLQAMMGTEPSEGRAICRGRGCLLSDAKCTRCGEGPAKPVTRTEGWGRSAGPVPAALPRPHRLLQDVLGPSDGQGFSQQRPCPPHCHESAPQRGTANSQECWGLRGQPNQESNWGFIFK